MAKYYFFNKDDETCYQKESIIDLMKMDGLTEATVIEAKRVKHDGYFYCRENGVVGETGECGRICNDYKPRNGKSGICKHYGNLYEATDKTYYITL